jgi:transcription-repair coupling factor (superfamily II helicase)
MLKPQAPISSDAGSAAPCRVSGLPGGSEAWWLLQNRAELGRCLVLTGSDEAAETLADDLEALALWQDPAAAPPAYFADDDADAAAAALSRWAGPAPRSGDPSPGVLVSSWEQAQKPLPEPEAFRAAHRWLGRGDQQDRSLLLAHLAAWGYSRVDSVEQAGEAAVRGEVVDLWPPGVDAPVRLLWPFDRIESIRKINLSTQRSTDLLDGVWVRPRLRPGKSTLLSYAAAGDSVYETGLPPDAAAPGPVRRFVRAELGGADRRESFENLPPFAVTQAVPGFPPLLLDHLKAWLARDWKTVIFCRNAGEQERLEELLVEADRALGAALDAGRIQLPLGPLARGFLDPSGKLAILSNGQVFGRARRRLRLPKFAGGRALSAVADLAKGDYVVHERFGVGRYRGLEHVRAGGVEGDYLRLEYKGGDRVLVPLFEFRQVQKFIGTEGKKPKLSSLDTATWERTKEKVQEAIAELAKELLDRAAKRAALPGIPFPPDTHLEKEFGDSFHYEPTPDQARAIEEVKADMLSPRPMDRLVCGDVGYGKTEVAMRAAFKAAMAGRQVAVLVPTTILAEQHGRNFRERFADYPVSVAVLSRFASPAEEKKILADLRRGVIDVVIGTHRLISPDVAFKNLGLIIVDEEHRFGVKQKERLMAFRDVVDVLALSATPIPRTLGAALGGVKNLSIIESPPEGRLPIATHVGPFDEKIVRAALDHELSRGGQVFYVHNRIGTLEARRRRLETILAERGAPAAVAVAHGQMSGPHLEKIMWDFLHKKFSVLLATSIIESGLDIPTVNTLIVEEAEDFGLAQLYQLRGRVGRERQKAYCYLFYSPGAHLTEEAQKRLSALHEFSSLGSGFKLALRDLEIRGAGNLLGPQQHGFVNAVGIDLYGQLLTEEIERQQGQAPRERDEEVSLEIPVAAYLPEDFLPSEAERVALYKRLVDLPAEELPRVREELVDRCGQVPAPVDALLQVVELRAVARRKKAARIAWIRQGVEIYFRDGASLSPESVAALVRASGESLRFLPGGPGGGASGIRLEDPPENLTPWLIKFLSKLG